MTTAPPSVPQTIMLYILNATTGMVPPPSPPPQEVSALRVFLLIFTLAICLHVCLKALEVSLQMTQLYPCEDATQDASETTEEEPVRNIISADDLMTARRRLCQENTPKWSNDYYEPPLEPPTENAELRSLRTKIEVIRDIAFARTEAERAPRPPSSTFQRKLKEYRARLAEARKPTPFYHRLSSNTDTPPVYEQGPPRLMDLSTPRDKFTTYLGHYTSSTPLYTEIDDVSTPTPRRSHTNPTYSR